jgi:hypothetical protein
MILVSARSKVITTIFFVLLIIVSALVVANQIMTNTNGEDMRRLPYRKICDKFEFVEYKPSEYEKLWYQNIEEWQTKVCDVAYPNQTKQTNEWIEFVNSPESHPSPDDLFSSFIFKDTCSGDLEKFYIEPIASITRDPRVCNPWGLEHLYKTDYLVTNCKNYEHHPKSWLFDLGAGLWKDHDIGSSLKFFYEKYGNSCHTHFDGIYAYELRTYPSQDVWDQVPNDVIPFYHYFNLAITTDNSHLSNPLYSLRAVAKPEDFVVFKLDIDTPHLEQNITNTILEDPYLTSLIDVFYFEHHVNVEPLSKCCWGYELKDHLIDTYHLFRKLRNAGISAHSWN